MFKKILFGALFTLLFSGCATVIKGTNEDVSINSLEDDTIIYVNGAARGKDYSATITLAGPATTILAG